MNDYPDHEPGACILPEGTTAEVADDCTLHDHAPLPEPEPLQPDETVVMYGSRVLAFLLRENVYATVPTTGLQLAEHAAVYAVAHHDVLPSVVDRISAVRHIIAQTLRVRLQDAAMDATLAIGSPVDTRPNNGPMARLQDAPLVKPPAPSYAEIERVRAAIAF